jgi:geranylgeranyl pyrophosphate synthase
MEDLKKEFDFFLELFLEDYPQYRDVFYGGKRLRPILVFETASHLNPLWRTDDDCVFKIKQYALVLELIHCTSLIIDDLPSMDNDIYRRGELTFHTKYGRHAAYLMVYNLLSTIKNILWENDNKTENYIDFEFFINEEMSNLVMGQKYDLDIEWKPSNLEEEKSRTLKIAELKTSSLFKLTTVGPFYLLTNNINDDINIKIKEKREKLYELGLNIGMAFQLSDDNLDLDTDLKTNNYGLETSPLVLFNKYTEYHDKIIKNLNDLEFKKESVIYDILKLMNKRFSKKIQ